jgi:uncharacterized protein YsxB (DUF464 family)
MATEIYTIGSGGDYTTLDAFIDAYNAGTIGTGNDLVGELISDITQGTVSSFQSVAATSVTIRSNVLYTKRKITKSAVNTTFRVSTGAAGLTLSIADIEVDGNGTAAGGGAIGAFIHDEAGAAVINVDRCVFHNVASVAAGTFGSAIVCSNASTTQIVNVRNSIVYNVSSSSTSGETAAFINYGGSRIWNLQHVLVDSITHTGAQNASACHTRSGTATWNLTNVAVTRISGGGPSTSSFIGSTFNLTTTATEDADGDITGIDELNYVDADNGDFRLSGASVLEAAGTILTGEAAITFDGVTRTIWDISPYQRPVATTATYTVGSGGDYTTTALFVTDLNAGTIGALGEHVVASIISDITQPPTSAITSTLPNRS